MKIYFDIVGTLVDNKGGFNEGALLLIKLLHQSGHQIIFNTSIGDNMPSEKRKELIEKQVFQTVSRALLFNHDYQVDFKEVTEDKIWPHPWDLEQAKIHEELYIDDYATKIPLKKKIGEPLSTEKTVDCEKVMVELVAVGIIKAGLVVVDESLNVTEI